MGDNEPKMTPEELLQSAGATNFTSAPKDMIDSITKGTIPDATPLPPAPAAAPEEKKVTKGEVFQPSEELMELLTTTGERRAQPIRNPAHAFFNINSIDRYASAQSPTAQFALITQSPALLNASPASSYNMNLGRNLMSGYFHRLTVTDVNIQWNIPTINIQNYLFVFGVFNKALGVSAKAVIRIPYGFYTFVDLASMMLVKIVSALEGTSFAVPSLVITWTDGGSGTGAGFNFSTSGNNQLITLSATFPVDYTGIPDPILFPNEGSIQTGTSLADALRAMYKFYTMLGVTSQILDNFTDNFTTNPTYPTLIYTSYVDVISNKLSQFMRVKDSETSWSPDTSVITRIYLTNQGTITAPSVIYNSLGTPAVGFTEFAVGSRPFILNYTPTTPKNIKWSPNQAIVDFDIRVIDEFGDLVPWSLSIPYKFGNESFTTASITLAGTEASVPLVITSYTTLFTFVIGTPVVCTGVTSALNTFNGFISAWNFDTKTLTISDVEFANTGTYPTTQAFRVSFPGTLYSQQFFEFQLTVLCSET